MRKIKCISLWQPWAWLCVATDAQGKAEKQYETRHWPTNFRGTLLIHAAKRWTADQKDMESDRYLSNVLMRHNPNFERLEAFLDFGCIIGQVDLVGCYRTERVRDSLSKWELAFGNYADDRYAWKFTNPVKFKEPIPYKGSQGFFDVDANLIEPVWN